MKEFGKILKFFRESKNLSLREVAGSNLSSSQISRFERGETSLSIDNFYYCLKNMNVTFREFEIHLKNFIQDDNTVFDKSISEAYLEGNISKLESLLKTLDTQSGKIAKLNSIVIKIAIFCVILQNQYHRQIFNSLVTIYFLLTNGAIMRCGCLGIQSLYFHQQH
ncbi:TPA: helix-turn-helix transcriptional regulator [Streptococcus suis]|nr:helix-turn-helix transcriptional regulator [Streptococcus suis]